MLEVDNNQIDVMHAVIERLQKAIGSLILLLIIYANHNKFAGVL